MFKRGYTPQQGSPSTESRLLKKAGTDGAVVLRSPGRFSRALHNRSLTTPGLPVARRLVDELGYPSSPRAEENVQAILFSGEHSASKSRLKDEFKTPSRLGQV